MHASTAVERRCDALVQRNGGLRVLRHVCAFACMLLCVCVVVRLRLLGMLRSAFSQYPRPYSGFPTAAAGLPPFDMEQGGVHKEEQVMGHTIRVDQWRCESTFDLALPLNLLLWPMIWSIVLDRQGEKAPSWFSL
jgi:hypothetical protein